MNIYKIKYPLLLFYDTFQNLKILFKAMFQLGEFILLIKIVIHIPLLKNCGLETQVEKKVLFVLGKLLKLGFKDVVTYYFRKFSPVKYWTWSIVISWFIGFNCHCYTLLYLAIVYYQNKLVPHNDKLDAPLSVVVPFTHFFETRLKVNWKSY